MINTDYETGDSVRIRNDLKTGEYYGRQLFNVPMTEYKGKICRIKTKVGVSGYLLYEAPYIWTDEMLEKVERTPRYKIGDHVKVREDLHVGEYDECHANDEMVSEAGATFMVNEVDISSKIRYRLSGNRYYWAEEMLEDDDTSAALNQVTKAIDKSILSDLSFKFTTDYWVKENGDKLKPSEIKSEFKFI